MIKKIFFLLISFLFFNINCYALGVKSTINQATQCMVNIANDDSHGYNSQVGHRWGEDGDFCCSTLNEYCWDLAGVKVRRGQSDASNQAMVDRYLSRGFVEITYNEDINLKTGKGLEKGDVLILLNQHVAQYVGDGKIVEATANELGGGGANGGGGTPGDQTGGEIAVNSYRGGWDVVLRYEGSSDSEGGGSTVDTTDYISPLYTQDATCETVFVNEDGTDKEFKTILKGFFTLIEVITPVITIALTVIEYIKAIGDPAKIKKANKNTIIRFATTVAIVFIPFILNLLFNVYGLYDLRNCILN